MHPARAPYGRGPGEAERTAELPLKAGFELPIERLKGVGPARLAILGERGIRTVLDLLLLTPLRYRTAPPPWEGSPLAAGADCTVRGVVAAARRVRHRGGGSFLDLRLTTPHGPLRACFYHRGWLKDRVSKGDDVLVAGRITGTGPLVMAATDLWTAVTDQSVPRLLAELRPVHPAVAGIAQGTICNLVDEALMQVAGEVDPVEPALLAKLGLPSLIDALRAVHQPATREDAARGGARLLFDRLLAATLVARRAGATPAGAARPIETSPLVRARIGRRFPFTLTPEQDRALTEILGDLARPRAMRRLLLGDVGSGKTAVAVGALLAAVAAGFQALFVAPTELLAAQHHRTLGRWLADSRVRLALVTSRQPPAERRAVKAALRDGSVDLLIGTHASLAEDVTFARLGVAVVDEQHRFGVMQRLSARAKGEQPHLLAMSATPIPRSLCLALFGEIDVTRIEGRPGGRRTPPARIVAAEEAFVELRAAVARGERAFVVFPSIESDEKPAVEREGRALSRPGGALGGLRVEYLHGRMATAEQLVAFDRFRGGEADVLVSTVIVEVGVDIPEATVMVVVGADRFGVATLHQLRGRVGRGSAPGRVFLVPSDQPGRRVREDVRARLELLERETDGFRIAEADLLLRGPGDWCGVRQHGFGGELPFEAGQDAGFIDVVAEVAGRMIAAGYDPHDHPYLAALGAAIGGVRFEPRDAV